MKALLWIVAILIVIGTTIGSLFVYNHYSEKKEQVLSSSAEINQQPKAPNIEELLVLINAERSKVGVQPLILDNRLNQSAQAKAEDMSNNNYYDHVNPTNGKHGYEYIAETGINCLKISENIDRSLSSNEAVEEWVKSKPHYEAMINLKYTHTGFGLSLVPPGGNTYNVVEHFCQIK